MANFDDFKLAIEQLSGGKNTVLFDDREMPSVMVPFNKFAISDVITGGSGNTHPAFLVNSVEKSVVYVSKFQNIVLNDRAYSLAGKDPRANVNFDQSFTYCRNKGRGWSLMPYSLWAALALWCRKNETMPRGNNNNGADHGYPHEKGTRTGTGSAHYRTATGSGPATWCHNWLPDGIADLNGNVWEWCAGMRLNEGEIQIIPYANIFDPDISNAAASTAWKAIASDGTLAEPGANGTLKYDGGSFKLVTTLTGTSSQNGSYASIGLESGLTAPELAKALILYPDTPGGDYGGDYHYWTSAGERLPICGGDWTIGATAGVFIVHLYSPRSLSRAGFGFRSAYCDL